MTRIDEYVGVELPMSRGEIVILLALASWVLVFWLAWVVISWLFT